MPPPLPQQPIRLVEEFVLLMLNPQTGYLEMAQAWSFDCAVAGTVLADLAFENRIDTDLKGLYLVDRTPTGDNLLDPTLQQIAEAPEFKETQYWIEKGASHAQEIVHSALDRLVQRNILSHTSGGFWGLAHNVSRTSAYPALDKQIRQEAKARILNLITSESIPDPQDAVLIALVHMCDGFKLLLEKDEYEAKLEWIKTIEKLELVGRTVAEAVRGSTAKASTRTVLQRRPIPKLRIRDVLREPHFRSGNIARAMCGIYQKHGPIVRMPFKIRGSPVVALIGQKMNQWVNRNGRNYLRTKDYIKDFEQLFGASRTLPGMDGAEHYRLRKALRHAYSRTAIELHMDNLVHLCRKSLASLEEGHVFRGTKTIQNLMSSQVSNLAIGVNCSHYAEEILKYQHRALITHVAGILPKFMASTPSMRRYRKRFDELQNAIKTSHTPAQRKGQAPDIADAILELHTQDPQFLPESDIGFPFVASMVASIYLGSALTFAVYCMVRRPDLQRQVFQEAKALFGSGRRPQGKDFSLKSIDVTHRLCLEAQRLYPVIPWQTRTVMNPANINGFELPVGTRLLICHTAPHYLDELFRDPLQFDIDRYLPERAEHHTPGAYAPYGLGTHTCLGNRWVELQMVVNVMLIAYHMELDIVPKRYRLGINPFPTCAPNKKLKFRVRRVMNPF